MLLHTPTLFLVVMVTCLVLGASIAFIAYRRHANLLLWAAGLGLHGLGYALYSLRGHISDVVSIVVANVVISSAFALFGEGLYRFQSRKPLRPLLWGPVLITAIGFSVLLDNQQARFVLAGLAFGLQLLLMLVVLFHGWRDNIGRGPIILAVGALIVLGVMVARVWGVLSGAVQINALADSSPAQGYTFMAVVMGVLLLSIGLVMMNHERAEQRLQIEQRAGEFRTEVLERLARGDPLREVLLAMVLGIERLHPGMQCSVLQVDRQGRHLVDGVAPHLPTEYNIAVEGLLIEEGAGSCGTAAFQKKLVVVPDVRNHPYWSRFADLAARHNLRACWSQPILSSSGAVLGTFAIHHKHVHTPSRQDVELIEQSARLASIAIERSREAAELKQSEARYRRLVDNASEGICVVSGDLIRLANPKLCQATGYAQEELLGRYFLNFIHEDDHSMLVVNRHRRLQGQMEAFQYPVRILTRNQGVRWFELSGAQFEWDGQPATLNFLSDITDRRAMEERVRQLAYHDTLTQLPNRRLLMDRLGQTMARLKRSGQRGALMFLDLDNFKPLNDQHGHDVGDLLLIEVALRLRKMVREADTVARFGGDEFVLILGDLDEDESAARAHAFGVAQKVLDALSQPYKLAVPPSDGQGAKEIEHACSASIGLAMFMGQPGTEEDLLRRADSAMYTAKQSGHHTIRFDNSAPGAPGDQRRSSTGSDITA